MSSRPPLRSLRQKVRERGELSALGLKTLTHPKYLSCDQEGSGDQPESESSVSQPSAFTEHLLYTGSGCCVGGGDGQLWELCLLGGNRHDRGRALGD